jgi:hypothetical protein
MLRSPTSAMLRPTSGPWGVTRASTLYSRAFSSCSTGLCRSGSSQGLATSMYTNPMAVSGSPIHMRLNRLSPESGTVLTSRLLTIRLVLVPISVHMPARITRWFMGISSFEIE